jgi:phosphatidylinositol alpha-1,6-mannosyltransferase
VVSAGLGLSGGGSAALGRLVVSCAHEYAETAGAPFSVLHLGSASGTLPGPPVRHFDGDQRALAAALVGRQGVFPRPALVFDHLGPARVQAYLPSALRSRYAVFLLGIEVASRLSWDRRRALRGAELRLAISEHTRALALRSTPGLADVAVLHPALEGRAPAGAVDQALVARAGEGYLLIVGRMAASERYKGHDALLEALARLTLELPAARLVVAGEGGDRARLEARARELGLAKRVLFTGFVSEATLAELHGRSRAFVMPSSGEGFGLVYLEAMRAGKPCVALKGGAAEEIVADGVSGVLVDASPGSLSRALVALLGDRELAARLGAAGRRRFEEHFSRERFRAEFAVRLERLLERSA